MTETSGSLEETTVVEKPKTEVAKPTEKIVEKPKSEPVKAVVESPKAVTEDAQYRLNIFNAGGTLKASVPVAVYQDMCRRNAEIIRSLSSTKWMTMDEILEKVWYLETKMRHPVNRTRKNVEAAIKELLEREMVSVK